MTRAALASLLGSWGLPPDLLATACLVLAFALAIAALLGRGRSVLGIGTPIVPLRMFLAVGAFVAAMLSVLWIALYLRGGPRIIDATTYFLQGRAMAHGDLAWAAAEPSASFRGRFLVYRDVANAGSLGGIFPPGYPLLLACGFALGAPMIIGPLLAAALVVATYRLARTIAEDAAPLHAEPIARAAAILSIVCGALRYHTADTMSHGATALGITAALDLALRKRALAAGLALGAVLATRPISSIPIGLVVFAVLAGSAARRRLLVRLALGLLPGALVLLASQHAVTGAWLASTQRMYYAQSDGPKDCFRYGFGANAGCLHEHGEFVQARLPHGHGLVQAASATLRRLRMHALDIANFEPLALLVFGPFVRGAGGRRSPAALAALAVVFLHVLAYAPFYFDGNYPGGGARFFADLLPIEHALVALAAMRLAHGASVRGVMAVTALALAGFGVHAAFEHASLAARDGGRPMFEPDVLAHAGVKTGLVFVDTDHGFALGHDPDARVEQSVVVARLRNDDRDRLLFESLHRPPTYLYRFDIHPSQNAAPPVAAASIAPWTPPASTDALRFEAEAEWPALLQRGGFAAPAYVDACASGGRALVLTPTSGTKPGRATATITVPVFLAGRYIVSPRVVYGSRVPFTAPRLGVAVGALRLDRQSWAWRDSGTSGCADLGGLEVDLAAPRAILVLEAEGGAVALDKIELRRLGPSP